MLMWGLALRHGWGIPQREKDAFMWLRKAAEGALDSAGPGSSSSNLNEKSAMISAKGLGADIQVSCFFLLIVLDIAFVLMRCLLSIE
jgi:TPR repeat protein